MDFQYQEGDLLFDRFVLEKKLGSGGFGQVFRAFDLLDKTSVAVKVSYGTGMRRRRNIYEAEILQILKENRSLLGSLVVHMKTWYYAEDCVIIILELLPHNLETSIQNDVLDSFQKISIYGKQMMEFLVHMSSMNIIHGDIKPENILVQKRGHQIKFADFGLSYSPHIGMKSHWIQTVHYRSPEVLLGYSYEQSADMWSVACVLLECLFKQPVFNAHSELGVLQQIIQLIGMPQQQTIEYAPKRDNFFFFSTRYNQWLVKGYDSPIEPIGVRDFIRIKYPGNSNSKACIAFTDLIEGMLQFHPFCRLNPHDCLRSPFFYL